MADNEKRKRPDLNPTNMAGARRLLADPEAMDEAMEHGLGPGSQRPDPTYDDTSRRRKK